MNNENASRRIFSKGKINSPNKNVIQKVKYNREHILSKDTAHELNTYLNFGVFPTFADTKIPYYDNNGNEIEAPNNGGIKSGVGTPGVRSIFNKYGAIIIGSSDGSYNVDVSKGDSGNTHYWRISNNVPLMDSPEARRRIRKSSGCSVKELVDASAKGELGQETYSYSDFMYCKHLGKVSNNYMITLRRFPLPIDDYISTTGEDTDVRLRRASKNSSSIGCMVTWIGVSGNDMSNVLKYSFKMPFKYQTAELQNANDAASDNNTSTLNGIFSMFDEKYRAQYQAGYSGEAAGAAFEAFGVKDSSRMGRAPYKNHTSFKDRNKVYGPVDVIKGTFIRSDDGVTFDQKLSLVFEYELRSYNGINPKQAMLDLLSNILNVTYTTGTFWGGGFHGFAAHQSNVFANLNIFKARGGFTNFVDALSEDLSNLGNKAQTAVQKNGGIMNTIKSLLNNIGGMLMSGMLNKLGRPQKTMFNSLLSPAPIGFWHVTIGNPKHPIMSIGNMVITNVTVEHNGPLGLDDFPTGLKVTVELDRGKPRDIRDIEKLYMHGTDRIYTSMGDKVFDMYKNSELYKKSRTSPGSYNPVTEYATINIPADSKSKPTISMPDYDSINSSLMKYFGTTDSYSIYVPATEQEYGAGKKKPSQKKNKNVVDK